MTKLQDILKNPNDKLLAIDMDGTICEGEFWGEGEPKPKQDFIDKMWTWYKKGAHIVIYTARQPIYYPETYAWLFLHTPLPIIFSKVWIKPNNFPLITL